MLHARHQPMADSALRRHGAVTAERHRCAFAPSLQPPRTAVAWRATLNPEAGVTFLTNAQRTQMLANGAARARGEAIDPYPVVKLYTLDAGAVWLLTALDADGDLAYGLTDAGIGFPELGLVSLSALAGIVGPRGLRIVADPHFKARQSLSAYTADAIRDGSIND